mgnify:CR=1 FL=1
MSMWTTEEREIINQAIMYEEDLALLAYKAYQEAKEGGLKLKDVLKKSEYKPVVDYYSFEQIVDDVLRYEF